MVTTPRLSVSRVLNSSVRVVPLLYMSKIQLCAESEVTAQPLYKGSPALSSVSVKMAFWWRCRWRPAWTTQCWKVWYILHTSASHHKNHQTLFRASSQSKTNSSGPSGRLWNVDGVDGHCSCGPQFSGAWSATQWRPPKEGYDPWFDPWSDPCPLGCWPVTKGWT